VSLWQHAATYLLYFVMLMNVFVTTFGISGGVHGSVFGGQPRMQDQFRMTKARG